MRYYYFLAIVFLLGCNSNQDINYDWMAGSWQVEGKDNVEIWHKLNTHSYQGIGYIKSGKTSQVSEYMRLYLLDNVWNYSATVAGQNQGKDVVFIQKKAKLGKLNVQNLSHDYPKTIEYHYINQDKIEVYINRGKEKEIHYYLNRTKGFNYDQ